MTASAIDKYEKDLLLDVLREDLLFYKKTYTEKQHEMWTTNRVNGEKTAEYETLTKKLAQGKSNLDVSSNSTM